MAILLMNDVCHIAVIDFGYVSSRIVWIRFWFLRVKEPILGGYGPRKGNGEEREMLCNKLDRVSNGYILCILEDLNRWVGDMERVGVTGTFRVPR